VTGSGDETARMWDLSTGNLIHTFSEDTWVNAVAISPDGSRILTAGYKIAKLWNASTGNHIRTYTGHMGDIRSLAFSTDGQHFLTGSWDCTAKLWATSSSSALRTFVGHPSYVNSVAFSPDGATVLTAGDEEPPRLWETSTARLLRKFEQGDPGWGTACGVFSPEGDRVLCGTGSRAWLWDTSGVLLRQFGTWENGVVAASVAFLPDGRQVLMGGADFDDVTLWDLSDLKPSLSIGLTNGLPEIRWTGAATLQQSASVPGTWSDLTGVNSPYRITSPAGARFFRLRVD